MIKRFTLSAAAIAATFTALPAAAEAQRYDGYYDRGGYEQRHYGRGYDRRYSDNRYYGRNQRRSYYNGDRRCSGTTGTIVGAGAGALLGRSIDGGRNRTTGTIAGGVLGALLGREVGKSSCRR